MIDLPRMLDIARDAVGIGVDLVKTSTPHEIRAKSDRDIVTDVDVKVEQEIRAYLRRMTPEFGFLGEEEGHDPGANQKTVWTLDPVDGTSNFAHGIPLCAVSLALVDQNRPVVASIAAPLMGLYYHATHQGGAFANNERMHVSRTSGLSDAIVSIGDYAVGPNADAKNKQRLQLTSLLAERVERVRMFGSAAWTSLGSPKAAPMLQPFWTISPGTQPPEFYSLAKRTQ